MLLLKPFCPWCIPVLEYLGKSSGKCPDVRFWWLLWNVDVYRNCELDEIVAPRKSTLASACDEAGSLD